MFVGEDTFYSKILVFTPISNQRSDTGQSHMTHAGKASGYPKFD